MNVIENIIFWLKAARVHTLPMSFMSWLVVFCLALKDGGNILLGILALIGVMLAHLGVNLIDDYFDYKNEVGTIKSSEEKKSIKMQKGKCKYLLDGKATLKQTLITTAIYFALAAGIGLILTIICGWPVVVIVLVASIFCLLYPKLTYCGLSEFAVGMTFAPLLFIGTYFVMTGAFSGYVVLVSISTGLLTIGLLHTHALMDYDFDIKENKKTLCTILKSKQNALLVLGIMTFTAYINIAVCVYLNIFPIQTLITFVTLPLAITLILQMKMHIEQPQIIPERKFWMGPMENWEEIQAANAQSFML
ncbi:MAG: prenyltransferase, partial [Candidatus Gastranaerophilaceae bacterium]